MAGAGSETGFGLGFGAIADFTLAGWVTSGGEGGFSCSAGAGAAFSTALAALVVFVVAFFAAFLAVFLVAFLAAFLAVFFAAFLAAFLAVFLVAFFAGTAGDAAALFGWGVSGATSCVGESLMIKWGKLKFGWCVGGRQCEDYVRGNVNPR